MPRLVVGLVLLGVGLVWSRPARAEPQGHVAVRAAACGVGTEAKLWQATRFCGAVVGDLLLLRQRNRDVGFGPFVELGTAGFWDVRLGGGASLLLPVSDVFPLVLSLGVYDHELRATSLGGTVFWGLRSYNFESSYNWAVGLYASGYRDLDARGDTLVSIGLELDGFFVLAPFMLAYQALR